MQILIIPNSGADSIKCDEEQDPAENHLSKNKSRDHHLPTA